MLDPKQTERVLDMVTRQDLPPSEWCWADQPHGPSHIVASRDTDHTGLCPHHRRQVLGHS